MTVFSRSVSRYQFIYTLVDSFIIAKLFKLAELYSIGHLPPCPPPPPLSSLPPFPLPISFPFLYSTPPPSLLLSPRYFFPPLSSLFCEFPSPFIHSILPPPPSFQPCPLSLYHLSLPHLIFHNCLLIASSFAPSPLSSPLYYILLSLSLSSSFLHL